MPSRSPRRPPIARVVALRLSLAEGLRDAMDDVWAAGDAVLPLDPRAPASVTAALLDRLRPAAVVGTSGTDRLPDAPPVPDGTAIVVATSGSTGLPTGVVLHHDTLAVAVERQRRRLGAGDGQPWLGLLPLHHVAGISVLLRSRAAGIEPTLHPRDDPTVVAAAPPSWISLVPAQLERLLDAGADLARHLGVLLGGARADPSLLARAAAAGTAVTTSYGMTETCGGCVYDGRPLDDVEVRADEGRLRIRGPVLADGRRTGGGAVEPLVDPDGWFTTGDLGEVTPDGEVVVHGRADDVVVSGGENVPLAPVRAALRAVPAVHDATVVGLPDPRWGTAVTAVVVPAADHPAPTLEQLRDAMRDQLRPSHLPTRLALVDHLPRTPLGKVSGEQVRRLAADAADGAAG